jgi:hypothetical protein
LRETLATLLQAREYALELGQDVWQFAVELDALRTANVSSSDLRWLASMRCMCSPPNIAAGEIFEVTGRQAVLPHEPVDRP